MARRRKPPDTGHAKDDERREQHHDADPAPHVWHARNERGTHSLARVGGWIHRRQPLEPFETGERRPWVLAAPGEGDRQENEREHEIDPLRGNDSAEGEADRGADQCSEDEDHDQERHAARRHGIEPSTSTPTGNITTEATRARILANMTFSMATHAVGSGASKRSWISFVPENSMTSGSVVLWMAVKVPVSAGRCLGRAGTHSPGA